MARILVNMPSQFGGKPSGVARVAFSLLERLLASGRHDYVLRSNWEAAALPPALGSPRLRVERVPRPGMMILDMVRQLASVPALCRRLGIDVVWNVDAFGAARGGLARVTTVHDLYFRTVPELVGARAAITMGLCTRLVLSGSTRVAAISDATRADLAAAYPATAARTETIRNDATLGPAMVDPTREIAGDYVLIVGNGTPNKNYGVAVEALARLAAAGAAPALVHVGRDESGMIGRALAAAPGLVFHRLSDVGEARLAGLYAHALCLVVPSLSEGFCLPIVEAQALSCPVIAANASVMPEVAGDAALFFDPRDPAALCRRIAALAADPALRADLIARGHVNRARFSWDESARRYDALFAELAETRR